MVWIPRYNDDHIFDMVDVLQTLIEKSKSFPSSAKPTQVWHADDIRDCGKFKVYTWTDSKKMMFIAPGVNVTTNLIGGNPVVGYGDFSILSSLVE